MREMKKNAAALAALALVCKLIGFVKDAVLAYYFGTSYVVDAFTMVDSLNALFCGWIVALATVYLPSYMKALKDEGAKGAENFTDSVIRLGVRISIIFVVFIYIFRKQAVFLFASSSSDKMKEQMQVFLLTAVISMAFLVIYRISRANMDSRGKYIFGGGVDLLISVMMLVVVFLSGVLSVGLLKFVLPISYGMAAVVCIIFLYQTGFKFCPFAAIHPAVRSTVMNAVPLFFNTLIIDITGMTDKFFAASLTEGTISMLTYASMIESAAYQIIGVPIVNVVYPAISESVLCDDHRRFRSIYSRGMDTVLILFVPLMAATTLLSSCLIAVIYQRGNFSAEDTYYTQSLLKIYIWGAMFVVIREVTSRLIVAINDAKVVLYVGIFTTVFNILLDFVFIRFFGVKGLALATTISIFAGVPIFLWKGKGWINRDVYRRVLPVFLKSIAATVAMSAYVILIKKYIGNLLVEDFIRNLAIILVSAVGGVPIYFFVMYFLQVEEVANIMNEMKERIVRRKD